MSTLFSMPATHGVHDGIKLPAALNSNAIGNQYGYGCSPRNKRQSRGHKEHPSDKAAQTSPVHSYKRMSMPKQEERPLRRPGSPAVSNLNALLQSLLGVIDHFGCFVIPMHASYVERTRELLGLSFVRRLGYAHKMQEYTLAFRRAIRTSPTRK